MQIEEAIKKIKGKNIFSSEKTETGYDYMENINEVVNILLIYVETMHKEFDRLEGIEDNTAILKYELEKQQAELQDKDNYLEQISQCLNNIAIDQIPIAIAELKFFIDLKDKQIDLMAKEIDKEPNPDICKQMEGMACNNREILCTECIKQYFSEKVSE